MKSEIKIINFLYLNEEKYFKILEYRNQEFIRKNSLNTAKITPEEHKNYKALLEKKDKFFAFLVLKDDEDYGVISLKKIKENHFELGDYLVNKNFQFEGGGVVLNMAQIYLLNALNVKILSYDVKCSNTRRLRDVKEAQNYAIKHEIRDGLIHQTILLNDINSPEILNWKQKKLFDKLYEIKEILI